MTDSVFDNPKFQKFRPQMSDAINSLVTRVNRFSDRVLLSQTSREYREMMLENDGVIFYLPTLAMGDVLHFDDDFSPEQVDKSRLYLDVGFTPIGKQINYWNMLVSLKKVYAGIPLDIIQDELATERLYGGISDNPRGKEEAMGLAIPIGFPRGRRMLVHIGEHWQIANKELQTVTANFERYFVLDYAGEEDGLSQLVSLNNTLPQTRPDCLSPFLREWLKHDSNELNTYSQINNLPKYFEKVGMFVNYQGSLQFGLPKQGIEKHINTAAIDRYNTDIQDSGFDAPDEIMPPQIKFRTISEACQRMLKKQA